MFNDKPSGMKYLVPWSWLWRRSIVILVTGGVIFTLFYGDTSPLRDPQPASTKKQWNEIEDLYYDQTNDHGDTPSQDPDYPLPSMCSRAPPCPPCPVPAKEGSEDKEEAEGSRTDPDPLLSSVAHRRRIADAIAGVQRQISRVAGREALVDAKWSLILQALVEELDPRQIPQAKAVSSETRGSETTSEANKTRHVCPELYMGKRYDHPFYQHGMEMTNCSGVPKFGHVLTAILPALTWPTKRLIFVISELKKHYDIPVVALASKKTGVKFKEKNIKILVANKNVSEGALISGLMKYTKTPYIFIGSSLAHFNNQSSLERLVRVLDEVKLVKVVSGAARDIKGHWLHGCLQQEMGNYRVTYTLGYHHSSRECMYCDDLLSPFVTTKEFLTSIPLTDSLGGPALFRDWFAKIREAGYLVMACPDVMFYVKEHVTMNFSDWHAMARKWGLQDVKSYTNEMYSFSCESVNIECKNIRSITKSFLLPPCCIEEAHRNIFYFTDFAKTHGLEYELQAGSVLGAMKFGSFIPWDIDHDIFIDCKDFKIWTQEFSTVAKSYNCTPKVKYKNAFLKVMCRSFTLDILCRNHLSSVFLPTEYQKTPTTIMYGGQWTKVVSNPGLFSRNSIGSEILKHKQHSTHFTGTEASQGLSDQSGMWLPCKVPSHHSCLDKYPADGNLPFSL